MATMTTYLNFSGNTEEAFNFYKSVFGGEFSDIQRFSDTPFAGEIPEDERSKIMHISLPIAPGYVLMATDALESMGQKLTFGNNAHIMISTDSEAEADRIFNSLSEGGVVEMAMEKMFWGDYFGNFSDKFGVNWMINYEYPKA